MCCYSLKIKQNSPTTQKNKKKLVSGCDSCDCLKVLQSLEVLQYHTSAECAPVINKINPPIKIATVEVSATDPEIKPKYYHCFDKNMG